MNAKGAVDGRQGKLLVEGGGSRHTGRWNELRIELVKGGEEIGFVETG